VLAHIVVLCMLDKLQQASSVSLFSFRPQLLFATFPQTQTKCMSAGKAKWSSQDHNFKPVTVKEGVWYMISQTSLPSSSGIELKALSGFRTDAPYYRAKG
jgi:hypothetical protein